MYYQVSYWSYWQWLSGGGMDGGGWCEFEKPEIMGFALSMYYEQ